MTLFTVLATDAGINEPFVVPPVTELFEFPAFLFEGTLFAVNRTVLISVFGALLAGAFMVLALRKKSVVPSKPQLVAEGVVSFIRQDIAVQVIGKEGHAFVPFLTGLFLFVLLQNVWEVIPLVNFPASSRIGIPIVLTGIVYLLFIFLGFKHQGLGYLKNIAFPPGVPKPVYLLLTPIELVSTFVTRPVTLAVRLFANMLAGHILLTIIFLTIQAFLFSGKATPVGLVALAASPLMIGFELVVGILQAYIFTILTAVYISSSIHVEH